MENPIVQSELQDIATFRKSIIDSFVNIQHKLFQTKTSFKNYPSFNDNKHKNPIDYYQTSNFSLNTTNYFTQHENLQITKKFQNQKFQQQDLRQKYLCEYDIDSFSFDIDPQKQQKIKNNIQDGYFSQRNIRNQILSDKKNNSNCQIKQIQKYLQNFNLNNNRINHSSNQNYNDIATNATSTCRQQRKIQKRPRSQIRWHSQYRNNISNQKRDKTMVKRNNISNQKRDKTMVKRDAQNNSFCETSNNEVKKQNKKLIRSKSIFTSQRQIQKQRNKKEIKNPIQQEVHRRIKKRVYLSTIVYKGVQDNFNVIYQKQIKQRQNILNKIVNFPQVIKKFGKIIQINS